MNHGANSLITLQVPLSGRVPGQGDNGTGLMLEVSARPLSDAEALGSITEAGLFASVLGLLAQASGGPRPVSGDGQPAPDPGEAPAEPSGLSPQVLLALVREAGFDIDAPGNRFSLVPLPAAPQETAMSETRGIPTMESGHNRNSTEQKSGADLLRPARPLNRLLPVGEAAPAIAAASLTENPAAGGTPAFTTAPAAPANPPPSAGGNALPIQSDTPLRPARADWPGTFAARVVWMVEGGRERADLRLEPPQLGQLSVRVRLDGDQASLSFHSQHAMVREVVENALPKLRELMAEAGYSLVDVDIGSDARRDGDVDSEADATADPASRPQDAMDEVAETEEGGVTESASAIRLFDAYA